MLKRQLLLHGADTTWWLLLCVAAVGIALALIILLLRYERRLVPKHVGNTLLALRLGVLAVLFLTFLQPVLTWTLDRNRTGRVVVAVDVSESMTTADNHATDFEKLRWARALEMIGNSTINARLDRWLNSLKRGEEPEWVDKDEAADAERKQELAAARKENLQGLFDALDNVSRKEIALRLLQKTSHPLLESLENIANVELMVFAGKSEDADDETLSEFANAPPANLSVDNSNLSAVLSSAGANNDSSPVLGVVLLTDGRDNADKDPVLAAMRLRDLSIPVYPVLIGSEFRPKDLAIATLEYPQTSYKDDEPILKATLNTAGFEHEQLTVILEDEEGVVEEKTVSVLGELTNVEFQLDASNIGRRQYTIRTPVREGETREDNNRKTFAVNVVDDKARVLLVEGEARWEFRFIDNALDRDERVEAKEVLFDQPYIGVLNQPFFEQKLNVPPDPNDLEDSPFAEPDLVIIGDVSPSNLNETALALLEKFVAESGGTLVFIAGKNHMPRRYHSEILDRLLPVTDLVPMNLTGASGMRSPTERGFRLVLTPEGEREPMFQFSVDAEENRQIWNGLPGQVWGLTGEAKPGATVFAYGIQPDDEPALQAERRGAIFVHQHFGFGQVLWIGIDSTWRWRHRVGDQYHHRFWGQLARWAASNKASVGNEFVKFGPDQSDVEVGEDAILRARWTQQFLRRFPNLGAKVEVYREDDKASSKPFSVVELHPVDTRPLIHEGRVVSLPKGAYRLELVVEGADIGPEKITTGLYVHDKQTVELSDLSSNPELLTRLAETSSGRMFYPDEANEIPDLLQSVDLSLAVREETPLWDHWFILCVFFALLTTEWVMRKLNGLP